MRRPSRVLSYLPPARTYDKRARSAQGAAWTLVGAVVGAAVLFAIGALLAVPR